MSEKQKNGCFFILQMPKFKKYVVKKYFFGPKFAWPMIRLVAFIYNKFNYIQK